MWCTGGRVVTSGVALIRRAIFEPLFTTHPSEVGSTTPRTVLAAMLRGPLSHPICGQTIACCGGFERDARCIGFAILSSQPIPTDVSSQSMADSRDKLHLTRHRPIHAQNFTIRLHSTAQVPCSCLALTCSDVSSRPPCFGIFVMEGHISTIPPVSIAFFVPNVSTRAFLLLWPKTT